MRVESDDAHVHRMANASTFICWFIFFFYGGGLLLVYGKLIITGTLYRALEIENIIFTTWGLLANFIAAFVFDAIKRARKQVKELK